MKKRDIYLIIALLFIAASGLLFGQFAGRFAVQGQSEDSQAVIYLKDEEYLRVSLHDPQLVVLEHEGRHNEIHITEEGFSMHDANCDNQDCLLQGEVTLENMDRRLLGAWIICLPNQVSVELIRGEKE